MALDSEFDEIVSLIKSIQDIEERTEKSIREKESLLHQLKPLIYALSTDKDKVDILKNINSFTDMSSIGSKKSIKSNHPLINTAFDKYLLKFLCEFIIYTIKRSRVEKPLVEMIQEDTELKDSIKKLKELLYCSIDKPKDNIKLIK